MRIESLEITGFRGFPKKCVFDFNADAVIIVGANGYGKTSIFDAILWVLSGRVPRLGNEDLRLLSLYSETGLIKVEIKLVEPSTGDQIKVTRSYDGEEQRIALITSQGAFRGPLAEGKLIDLIWPDAASAADPSHALASALTRGTYLQQDLIQQFVDAESAQDRFSAFSELVGVGRVTEFQVALEKSKKQWSRATNQRDAELSQHVIGLTQMEARLGDLMGRADKASSMYSTDEWKKWCDDLKVVGIAIYDVDAGSRDKSAAIDHAIKSLESVRRSEERRIQSLRSVEQEVVKSSNQAEPDMQSYRHDVTRLQESVGALKQKVFVEQERLAEQRRIQTTLKEKDEQLKALAKLALNHLGDHCPVCEQTYDVEATRRRLDGIVAETNIFTVETESNQLAELLSELELEENKLTASESSLKSNEKLFEELEHSRQSLLNRLLELGFAEYKDANLLENIRKSALEAEKLYQNMLDLQRAGESLALRLAQSSDVALKDELNEEVTILQRKVTELEIEIAARNLTGELAQNVIEALRDATMRLVDERLNEIGSLLQGIYARVDPHPAFRVVKLLSRIIRGRGHLSTVVSDPFENKECDYPASVLSSSQLNALAISVFLSLNIGVPKPVLSIAMLDDPLQSLDDVNLLGLVDLLRRTKDKRQLFVTTHDVRFGSLLSRKLRPGNEGSRTVMISLRGWSRKGPEFDSREIEGDPVPLRLVVS